MTCAFKCEGCAVHVTAIGIDNPPQRMFCAACDFLEHHIMDREEMAIQLRYIRCFGQERTERGLAK